MGRIARPGLEPELDVERRAGRLVATSTDPWLRLVGLDHARLAGRFVEITYRASFWDEPVRPVLKVTRAGGGTREHIAAGPVAGAGIWIGRLPPDVASLAISPTNRTGPFAFEIESVRVRRWPALLVEGLRRNRRSTRSAILTRLIGWGAESDNNLAWAIGATPPKSFVAWHRQRTRPLALDELDRPRFDWSSAAEILIVVPTQGATAAEVRRTCDSLALQVFARWRLLLVDGGTSPVDPRIVATTAAGVEALLAGADPDTLVGILTAGDRLEPAALAYLAEQAQRQPDRRLFYGDALLRYDPAKALLLPGWSPRLQDAQAFLQPPVFLRDPARWSRDGRKTVAAGALPNALIAGLPPATVMPLRRFLVETESRPRRDATAPRPVTVTSPSASIIIPTRDHPALLRRAIDAIRRTTRRPCEIVVIDNGSTTPEATSLLEMLGQEADTVVLVHSGPFNFSQLCNEAAEAARGEMLVFLNDDTEVLSDDWLDRLCAHARDPATGAVGARLTYPDGRLQHVGVLLGMGGSAGHFGAPAPGDDPGWACRNLAVHEVSAVTGACLALAREKFEAVGGFDAVDLPIELSDIDLCLRLNARGWQTIVDPAVHIMHEESASRGGATLRRLAVHDRERAIFLARWRHVLRDDPFFHPGLSLYSWREALG